MNMRGVYQTTRRALLLVWHTHPRYAVTLCALTIIQGFVPATRLLLGKGLIDSVLYRNHAPGGHLSVTGLLLLLCVVSVVGILCSYEVQAVATTLGRLVSNRMSLSVLKQAARLDLSFFERGSFYDALQRAQRDGTQRPVLVVTLLVQIVQSAVVIGTTGCALLSLAWWSFPLLAVIALPQARVQLAAGRGLYDMQRRRTQESREVQYLAHVLTSVEYVKETKLFAAATFVIDRVQHLLGVVHAEETAFTRRLTSTGAAASIMATLGYIGFYAYVIYLASEGTITIGQLTLFAGAYLQCQVEIGTLCRCASGVYEHSLFIGNVEEYLAFNPILVSPSASSGVSKPTGSVLTFRNVSFRYPGTADWVLRNLNFSISRNELVTVVGANGAGKTSLAKLVCRFYDPDEGAILLDGIDIREVPLGDYQALVSGIFQDYSKYHMTAAMNIAIGAVARREDEAWIRHVAARSGAEAVVQRLPSGYDTMLGRVFRDGHELSIGEWQKIALARALMRDAQILVLDEPMAALDPKNEDELLIRLKELVRGRLGLLISHRLSSARLGDRILVLDRGAVRETGTHAELMAARGLYAAMYALQSSRYTDPGPSADMTGAEREPRTAALTAERT